MGIQKASDGTEYVTADSDGKPDRTLNTGDRVRYNGNPGDETDFGTVVLMINDKAVLIEWDNERYDCPEVINHDGRLYFGELFSVRDVDKIG